MAIDRVNRNELLNQLAVQATAMHADEKGMKKMQNSLDPDRQQKKEGLGIPDKFITK